MKLSGIVFIIIFLFLGFQVIQGAQPAEEFLVDIQEIPARGTDVRACEVDDDCIAIKEFCCDCDEGGKRTAINKKYYSHQLNERNDQCLLTTCEEAKSTDLSCNGGEPKCIEGQCQMR